MGVGVNVGWGTDALVGSGVAVANGETWASGESCASGSGETGASDSGVVVPQPTNIKPKINRQKRL